MRVLVTGGTGYIGSHVCVELIESGHEVLILDNLVNSKQDVLGRIEKICGVLPEFINSDIKDASVLERIFRDHSIDAVSHFAGLKSVSESLIKPLDYYDNNIIGTLNILQKMNKFGVSKFIFSSSATVYGMPKNLPIRENFSVCPLNPYAQSKLYIEEFLKSISESNPNFYYSSLRYFNPVGAHKSGLIGEDPITNLDNIMPTLLNVAIGKEKVFPIFGGDFDTHDGTGIRDYIHVVDLAKGHVAALDYLSSDKSTNTTINLGIGHGVSVLELVKKMELVSGKTIDTKFMPRRSGDLPICYSDPSLALELFNWKADYDLSDMCLDSWNWTLKNKKSA